MSEKNTWKVICHTGEADKGRERGTVVFVEGVQGVDRERMMRYIYVSCVIAEAHHDGALTHQPPLDIGHVGPNACGYRVQLV